MDGPKVTGEAKMSTLLWGPFCRVVGSQHEW